MHCNRNMDRHMVCPLVHASMWARTPHPPRHLQCGPHPPVQMAPTPTHSPPFHTFLPPWHTTLPALRSDDAEAEMWSSDSDHELTAAAAATSSSSSTTSSATTSPPPSPPRACLLRDTSRNRNRTRTRRRIRRQSSRGGTASAGATGPEHEPEAEDVWRGAQWEAAWPARRDAKPVVLAAGADDAVGRSRSLTDDDLEELKGCADLGFGFSYDEIPELRGTLPALELCYSMTQQRLLDDKPQQADQDAAAAPAPPVTNWKISSPGDSPDEVKARLKYWAQAVACTVRLCS
ncbi:hypothetical protein BS78_K289000 [Paspalum vaginatum]|uniref:Uncharacterized protein n=1 Tax=Paspalum vaginatum TaxID=158149 RepID=A0A9W8CDB0_9POAL|nr:hypothetical protein BS78_K289000 [Paspalum vaginatum]